MEIVKTLHILMIVSLLVVLSAGAAMAQYIYPSVSFAFTPSTWSYVYTVTVTPSDSFPLGYLELDTLIKNAGATAWTMYNPVGNGVSLEWTKTTMLEWQTNCDAAVWFVDQSAGQQVIYPSNWVGVFTLIAPNTQPGDGFGLTMAGAPKSMNSFMVYVPGPTAIVPEPSSIIALGSGLFGIGSMLLRRRKSS